MADLRTARRVRARAVLAFGLDALAVALCTRVAFFVVLFAAFLVVFFGFFRTAALRGLAARCGAAGFLGAACGAASWPRSCSRIAGFSSVETSWVISSPRAIVLSNLRMILPERVLGRLSARRMSSGLAMGPNCWLTHSRKSFTSALMSPVGRGPRNTT